jgi:hypothetical protein
MRQTQIQGSRSNEQFDELHVTFVRGEGQRSLSKIIASVELSARVYQKPSDSGVAFESSEHQKTPAKTIRRISGEVMRNGRAETQYVTMLNRSVCFLVGHVIFLPNS